MNKPLTLLTCLTLTAVSCGMPPEVTGDNTAQRVMAEPFELVGVDPALISEAVEQTDTLAWSRTIRDLSGENPVTLSTGETTRIDSRHSDTQGNTDAGQYIFDRLSALGYDVSFQPFQAPTGVERNVVATRRGVSRPDEIVVMGAHYDSTAPSASDAPGADDNGSGVATLIEAATILAGYSTDLTITFVAFGSEEQGLYGSRAFVQRAQEDRLNIKGAVICDMVGWYDRQFSVVVEGGLRWANWMNVGVEAAAAYSDVETRRSWYSFGSDHVPFQDAKIPAFLIIEEEWFKAPHYHQSSDTWSVIEPDFGHEVSRMVVASLAQAAGLSGAAVKETTTGRAPQHSGGVIHLDDDGLLSPEQLHSLSCRHPDHADTL